MNIDRFLQEQKTTQFLGIVDKVESDDKIIKFTLWHPVAGCLCQLVIPIRKEQIVNVSPIDRHAYCCGKYVQILELKLKDEATINAIDWLQALYLI